VTKAERKVSRLRPAVERIPLDREGPTGTEALLVLRDPLGLCEPLAVDRDLAGLLDLIDGTRTVSQLRQSMLMRGEADVSREDLEAFVDALCEAGLLDDDEFRARWLEAHDEFMARERREPWAAGLLFPREADALRALLSQTLPAPEGRMVRGSRTRGVVCPHQPFERAAKVLDATLRELPPADEIDVVVVLATDHHPGMLPFAVTDKGYATPLGAVHADAELVAALDDRLGWIRREEIRHRTGAPIEFAAVMLRWIYGRACPPMLPVLCGRSALGAGEVDHAEDFVAALELQLEGRRVLYWATAELAHAGPAYGGRSLDDASVADIRAHDEACLDALIGGKVSRFRQRCLEDVPHGRPSGAAALDVMVRLLPVGYRAHLGGYDAAPVDDDPARGRVGMAGVRFST